MKVAAIEKVSQLDWRITFERDGEQVLKRVVLGDCARSVYRKDQYRLAMAAYLCKAAREADRDIACRQHGKDFREHCEYKSNFWSPLSPEEFDTLFGESV